MEECELQKNRVETLSIEELRALESTTLGTLLRSMIKASRLDCVKKLLEANPEIINASDPSGHTALFYAVTMHRTEIAKHLITSGATGKGTLQLAISHKQSETVKHMIEHGADVNAIFDEVTCLALASAQGDAEIVKHLLIHGANVNTTVAGQTPLYIASAKGNLEVVKHLLAHQADVTIRSIENCTPLHIASSGGHGDIVKALLENGADLHPQNSEGATALHLASFHGHLAPLKHLIAHRADVNARNLQTATALHMASRMGHAEIAKHLLANGAKVNAAVEDGSTALHLASSEGRLEVVQWLIREGNADITARNIKEETPLDVAARSGRTEIVKFLAQNTDSELITKPDYSPEIVQIITTAMTQIMDEHHRTTDLEDILHSCTTEEIIAQLSALNSGVNDPLLPHGHTLLTYLAAYSQLDTLEQCLLIEGIDVNAKNGQHRTALQVALQKFNSSSIDNSALILRLIEAGAKPSLYMFLFTLHKLDSSDLSDPASKVIGALLCHTDFSEQKLSFDSAQKQKLLSALSKIPHDATAIAEKITSINITTADFITALTKNLEHSPQGDEETTNIVAIYNKYFAIKGAHHIAREIKNKKIFADLSNITLKVSGFNGEVHKMLAAQYQTLFSDISTSAEEVVVESAKIKEISLNFVKHCHAIIKEEETILEDFALEFIRNLDKVGHFNLFPKIASYYDTMQQIFAKFLPVSQEARAYVGIIEAVKLYDATLPATWTVSKLLEMRTKLHNLPANTNWNKAMKYYAAEIKLLTLIPEEYKIEQDLAVLSYIENTNNVAKLIAEFAQAKTTLSNKINAYASNKKPKVAEEAKTQADTIKTICDKLLAVGHIDDVIADLKQLQTLLKSKKIPGVQLPQVHTPQGPVKSLTAAGTAAGSAPLAHKTTTHTVSLDDWLDNDTHDDNASVAGRSTYTRGTMSSMMALPDLDISTSSLEYKVNSSKGGRAYESGSGAEAPAGSAAGSAAGYYPIDAAGARVAKLPVSSKVRKVLALLQDQDRCDKLSLEELNALQSIAKVTQNGGTIKVTLSSTVITGHLLHGGKASGAAGDFDPAFIARLREVLETNGFLYDNTEEYDGSHSETGSTDTSDTSFAAGSDSDHDTADSALLGLVEEA